MADDLSVSKSEFPLETCTQLNEKTALISTCLSVRYVLYAHSSPCVDADSIGASARSVTSEKLQNTAFGGAF